MVGTLQPKAACGASEFPDRYEQMQHPNGNLRSPQHAHTNSMQIPKRARCRETLSDLVGRVFSLDIAFYRTRRMRAVALLRAANGASSVSSTFRLQNWRTELC